MSYVQQQLPSVARAANSESSPSPRIAGKATAPAKHLTFDRRPSPHGYVASGAAPRRPQPVTPIDAPARPHRDVSTRFGQRLRLLRTERNLTQVRMAREFGVDRSYISDVERGRKSVSLPTMEIFALGLNVTLAELLIDV